MRQDEFDFGRLGSNEGLIGDNDNKITVTEMIGEMLDLQNTQVNAVKDIRCQEVTEFFDYGLDTIDFKTNLPKPVIKEYDGIKVVRDDLLDGGTKRRVFTVYVKSKPEIDEFVYASPRQGYAQLSLALCL